jgi:hypothetical protein
MLMTPPTISRIIVQYLYIIHTFLFPPTIFPGVRGPNGSPGTDGVNGGFGAKGDLGEPGFDGQRGPPG